VLSGSVVYALLPGVPGVVAVDRSTGRRLWSCPLAAARGIVALAQTEGADGLLAVETSTGLVGLRAADGSVAWRLPLTAPLDGSFAAVTTAGRTILTGFDGGPAADGGREPVLLRVDAGGGGILSRQAMPPLADAGPRIAPVVPGPGSLRILFGRGPDDPTRDLIVIAP
jgi:outer membrane protein assembly factor BamB